MRVSVCVQSFKVIFVSYLLPFSLRESSLSQVICAVRKRGKKRHI